MIRINGLRGQPEEDDHCPMRRSITSSSRVSGREPSLDLGTVVSCVRRVGRERADRDGACHVEPVIPEDHDRAGLPHIPTPSGGRPDLATPHPETASMKA